MRRHISNLCRGALILLPFLSGCMLGTDVSAPEWATVVLTASSPLSLEVLTSQKFLVTEGSVQLMDSSTETVSLPFQKTYTLASPARLFIRVTNATQQTVSFHFKVLMEDRTWMDDDKALPPGDKAEFVYRYDEPTLYR
ncbi:MAG: hypothetical protein FIA95_11550 [Gemmatimonadetes bacterium]|nr:hypothetical protein [Gemmatimonadota bacterium]